MNENLNLVEILKDVPEGTELYSTIFGKVTLQTAELKGNYPITVKRVDGYPEYFTNKGTYYCDIYPDAECVLFPSKEQRDWSKFVPPLKDGAPVMVSEDGKCFILRFYASIEENSCYKKGYKDGDTLTWAIIIPFNKFDPNNIEESLKYNIVK